jgi:hypothetical protein
MSSHATRIRPAASSVVGNVAPEDDGDLASVPAPGTPGFDAWVKAEAARMRQGDLDAADLGSFTTRPGEDGASIARGMLAPFVAEPRPREVRFSAWVEAQAERVRYEDSIAAEPGSFAPIPGETLTPERILTGQIDTSYETAVAALTAQGGMPVSAVHEWLQVGMAVALYLADCTVAELEAAREPAQIAALALPVVERLEFRCLLKIYNLERLAYRRGDFAECARIFPNQDLLDAALEAAFRWDSNQRHQVVSGEAWIR